MRNNNAILTITGSDSTGGSGVQADIKTISALGGYAVSAITSITVQNTLGIQEFYDIPADIVAGQIEAIVNDVQPSVIKVGLIRSVDVLNVVVGVLRRYHPRHVVYDPPAAFMHYCRRAAHGPPRSEQRLFQCHSLLPVSGLAC